MDPETDIEIKTRTNRQHRAFRAPWDPPTRPGKPRARSSDQRPDEPAVLGGYYEDPGRGRD